MVTPLLRILGFHKVTYLHLIMVGALSHYFPDAQNSGTQSFPPSLPECSDQVPWPCSNTVYLVLIRTLQVASYILQFKPCEFNSILTQRVSVFQALPFSVPGFCITSFGLIAFTEQELSIIYISQVPKIKMLKIIRLVHPRKKLVFPQVHPTLHLSKKTKIDMHPMSTAVFPLILGSPQVFRLAM